MHALHDIEQAVCDTGAPRHDATALTCAPVAESKSERDRRRFREALAAVAHKHRDTVRELAKM